METTGHSLSRFTQWQKPPSDASAPDRDTGKPEGDAEGAEGGEAEGGEETIGARRSGTVAVGLYP